MRVGRILQDQKRCICPLLSSWKDAASLSLSHLAMVSPTGFDTFEEEQQRYFVALGESSH